MALKALFSLVVWLLSMVSAYASGLGEHFSRICGSDGSAGADWGVFTPSTTDSHQTDVSVVSGRDGISVHYAYSKPKSGLQQSCVVVLVPGLSTMAIPFLEWMLPLSERASCDLMALEYRGSGLAQQRGSDRLGMKLAVLAGDLASLLEKALSEKYTSLFLLGHSMGGNVIWAYLQQFHVGIMSRYPSAKVLGLLPLDGALVAVPQARAAVESYPKTGSFGWSAMEEMTNSFLAAGSEQALAQKVGDKLAELQANADCFEAVYRFFQNPGFFDNPNLQDQYASYMCNFDCLSFGLLNKDSLFADYSDAVAWEALTFSIPTFVYMPEHSPVLITVQEFIWDLTRNITGSKQLRLSEEGGGVHFAIVPGATGREAVLGAMAGFVTSSAGRVTTGSDQRNKEAGGKEENNQRNKESNKQGSKEAKEEGGKEATKQGKKEVKERGL
eukprot:gb/GEZN01005756.1/.p1 GENE.gb/GEZN01005756.1/~~gb/GEZN01005756.1/.p1  ORF type:complete len:442 (-),score=77.15 gb/GEZN01005756.1/:321-1646(-)